MNPTPNNPRQLAGTLIAVFVGLVVTFGVGVPQAHAFSISDIPDAIESGIDWVQDKVDTAEGILATSEETVGTVLEGEQVLDGCQAVQGFEGDAFPGYAPPGEGGGGEDDTQPQSCEGNEYGNFVNTTEECQRKCDRLLSDRSETLSDLEDPLGQIQYRPENCRDIEIITFDDNPECTLGQYFCKDEFGNDDFECAQAAFDGESIAPSRSIETCGDRVADTEIPEFEKRSPNEFETDERARMRQHIPDFERWVVDNAQDEQWEDVYSWDGNMREQQDGVSGGGFCRQVAEIDNELVCPGDLENHVESSGAVNTMVAFDNNGCFSTVWQTQQDPTGPGIPTNDPPSCDEFDLEALEEELDL